MSYVPQYTNLAPGTVITVPSAVPMSAPTSYTVSTPMAYPAPAPYPVAYPAPAPAPAPYPAPRPDEGSSAFGSFFEWLGSWSTIMYLVNLVIIMALMAVPHSHNKISTVFVYLIWVTGISLLVRFLGWLKNSPAMAEVSYYLILLPSLPVYLAILYYTVLMLLGGAGPPVK